MGFICEWSPQTNGKSSSRPDLLEPAKRQYPHHASAGKAAGGGRKLPLDEATAAAASMNGLTVDLESVLGLQGRNCPFIFLAIFEKGY